MVHYLMKKRMEKLLEQSAVQVTCHDTKGTAFVFNVGPNLMPPMHLEIKDEGFSCILSVRGERVPVEASWESVKKVEPFYPSVKFV